MYSAFNPSLAETLDPPQARVIANVAFFFCFFPSLIYAIMPTQTQPVAAAFALPLLFLYPLRLTRVVLPFLVLTGIILFYMLLSLLVYPQNTGSIIGNAGAYISPLILFLAFQDKLHLLSPRPLFAAMWVWVGVGAIQAFPAPGFLKAPLQALGQVMLERFKAGAYSDSGRGVSLIASEPSISAPTIIFMGLSVLFFYREGKIRLGETLLAIVLVLFMIAINRSGTVGVLGMMVVVAALVGQFLRAGPRKRLMVAGLAAALFVGGGALLLQFQPTNIRVLQLFTQIVEFVLSDNRPDLITMAVTLGSHRIVPLLLGYGSLMHNYGLGHGIAAWNIPAVFNTVQDFVGIDPFQYYYIIGSEIDRGVMNKPQSFFSLIAYDTGFVGLVPLIFAVFGIAFYRGQVRSPFGDNRLIYVLPACFWLLLFGLSTLPAPWMLLAYSLHIARYPARWPAVRLNIILPRVCRRSAAGVAPEHV